MAISISDGRDSYRPLLPRCCTGRGLSMCHLLGVGCTRITGKADRGDSPLGERGFAARRPRRDWSGFFLRYSSGAATLRPLFECRVRDNAQSSEL
jgi:hypothetical protein